MQHFELKNSWTCCITNIIINLKEPDVSLDIHIQQMLDHEERENVNGSAMNNKIDLGLERWLSG